jgi:hypothetical protein
VASTGQLAGAGQAQADLDAALARSLRRFIAKVSSADQAAGAAPPAGSRPGQAQDASGVVVQELAPYLVRQVEVA